jgi:hypothetical protein
LYCQSPLAWFEIYTSGIFKSSLKMSYQAFVSPSSSRSNRSSSGSSLPLCSLYSGDHHAQQALSMGCLRNYNQVSFSPSDESGHQVNIPNSSSLITYQHLPSLLNTSTSTPRIMYPSTSYSQGNPGFYYDLMQNTNHAGSQTAMSHTLDYVPTYTHTPTYTPTHVPLSTSSNPTIHFGNNLPFVPIVIYTNSRPSFSIL